MIRRITYILFLSFISLTFLCAQEKRDYVWLVGHEGAEGSNNPDFGLTEINFKQETLDVRKADVEGLSFGSNSSSISNESGDLLFFTGGCFVYGKNRMLIEDGDKINEGEFRDRCVRSFSYISGNASTLFIPKPETSNEYYLIHQRIDEIGSNLSASLLYSIIDTSLNNGLGGIVEADIPIFDVRPLLGEMAAVKHGNGKDWWLIVPEDSTNNYNVLLVDENGIQNIHDQKIGSEIGFGGMGTGQCKFSPDGTKFARWTSTQQLLYAEFDRENGTFRNDQQITVIDTTFRGGVEFSPNSRYLYTASTYQLHQFDTESNDVPSTQILVAEWDGYQDFVRTFFSRLQLTPDCRIFISLPGSHRFWHIIHNPNEKGVDCNVEQRGLSFERWTFNTMPYFPNYNLGAIGDMGGYPCDSTKITVSSTDLPIFEPQGFVYPNPSVGTLQIDMPATVGVLNFQLFDISGKQVFTKNKILSFEEIDLGEIANGLYFYKIFDEKGRSWSGKVVVNK